MSLMHKAASIVARDGKSTADKIASEAGTTRQRAMAALKNASRMGLIHCCGRHSNGMGGKQPGIFAPGPAPVHPAPPAPPHGVRTEWRHA